MTLRWTATLTIALALFAAGACGDDDTEGTVVSGRIASVETTLDVSEIPAGGSATATCVALDDDGQVVEDAAFVLLLDPAGHGTASGLTISSTTAGVLNVACRETAADVIDETPAALTVLAGAPVRTAITVDPATIEAGQTAAVSCAAVDEHGNATDDPSYVAADPAEGLTVTDTTATGGAAGTYTLTCISQTITDSALQGTATLTVQPGAATAIELYFKPDALAYPAGKPIRLRARSVDAGGNILEEDLAVTNITATPDGHHAVVGTDRDKLRFDLEGKYTVTAALASNTGQTASAPIVIDGTPPELTLTQPGRGEVFEADNTISFIGTVSDNLGEVSLRIGDHEVSLPAEGGAFNEVLPVTYGLNLFEVVASDPYGNESLITRAAEKSTEYFAFDVRNLEVDGVDNAAVIVLTQDAIDDGVRDEENTDDLASVFAMILDHIDFASFVNNPLAEFGCIDGTCTLDFTGIDYSAHEVALTLGTGKLSLSVVLHDFSATITLNAPCALCRTNPTPLPGSVTSSKLTLTMDVLIGVQDGGLVASADGAAVTIDDFAIDIHDSTGILQALLDSAVGAIEPYLVAGLQVVFAQLIEERLGEAFASIFNVFAIDETFEVPSPIEGQPGNSVALATAPRGVDISPERLQMRLDAIAYAVNPARPFESLGSIGHGGCAPWSSLTYPPVAPMTVGAHDSLINQLLYAVWEGGTLSLDIAPGEGDSLVADFGITDLDLLVEARLPPVFNSCGRGANILQIGDLFLDVAMVFAGTPTHFTLWLQAEAAVDVEIGENDEGVLQAKLIIGDLDPLVVELITNTGLFEDNDEAVVDLIKETLVPKLLSTVGDTAAFDLPQIDLGALADGIPEGTIIELDVTEIGRDNAYLTVNGGLK